MLNLEVLTHLREIEKFLLMCENNNKDNKILCSEAKAACDKLHYVIKRIK